MFLKSFKRAFSLIELLLVISVLAILVAIGIPKIKGFKDSAKGAQAQKELQTMQAALQAYYTFTNPNRYPPTNSAVGANYLINAVPKELNSVIYDPFNGNGSTTEYGYKLSGNGKYFVVYSVGYNGTAGNIAIPNNGAVTGYDKDDPCATNGNGCEAGIVRISCSSGSTNCWGSCVNLSTSSSNCSSCGNACSGGLSCCSSSCVNLQTDTSNCGSCGNACAGGQTCSSGSCVGGGAVMCGDGSSCTVGQTCCSDGGGGYNCCPYDSAVCCADFAHCCPNGTTCDLDSGSCI